MENLIEFYRPLSGEIAVMTGASDSLAHVHGGMLGGVDKLVRGALSKCRSDT